VGGEGRPTAVESVTSAVVIGFCSFFVNTYRRPREGRAVGVNASSPGVVKWLLWVRMPRGAAAVASDPGAPRPVCGLRTLVADHASCVVCHPGTRVRMAPVGRIPWRPLPPSPGVPSRAEDAAGELLGDALGGDDVDAAVEPLPLVPPHRRRQVGGQRPESWFGLDKGIRELGLPLVPCQDPLPPQSNFSLA